jgi:hypothetical protein
MQSTIQTQPIQFRNDSPGGSALSAFIHASYAMRIAIERSKTRISDLPGPNGLPMAADITTSPSFQAGIASSPASTFS